MIKQIRKNKLQQEKGSVEEVPVSRPKSSKIKKTIWKENRKMINYEENERLRVVEEKANVEVNKAAALANIEMNKKATLENIELQNTENKAKRLVDIQAEKELQTTTLSCTADGSVILQHKGFEKTISGSLPIKFKTAQCYSHIGDVRASVLCAVVEKANGEDVALFWDLNQVEDRFIRKVFERQGMLFGFSTKKESEVRRMILQMARGFATTHDLPEAHGWYQLGDTCRYAFPEELTWEEVNKAC